MREKMGFKFKVGDKVKHNELIGNDNELLQGKIVDRFNSASVENWYTVRWRDYGDREMTEYYITYRNCGKPERTPIMPDAEKNAKHNVELLKIQGATSIRVHK